MSVTSEPREQAERVLRVIRDLGLQPYEAPEPLPEITDDDVHLVCWLAITSDPALDPADSAWFADGELPMPVQEPSGKQSLAEA